MKKKLICICCLIVIFVCSVFVFGCASTGEKNKQVPEAVIEKSVFDMEILATNGTAHCIVAQTYSVRFDCDKVVMQFYPLAYEKSVVSEEYISAAYPKGFSAAKITINGIFCNEKQVTYTTDAENCTLTLKTDNLKRGDRIKLSVDYEIELANIKHRLGYYNDCFSLCNFYPYVCYAENNEYIIHPYSLIGEAELLECADYNVKCTLARGYVVAHTGNTESTTIENGLNVTRCHAENVRDFAIIASPRFCLKTAKWNNTTIYYYYADTRNPDEVLETAQTALSTFGELFSAYPYESYTVVSAPFAFGGMEYSQLSVVSDTLKLAAFKEVLIHETAHQWWFGKVGSDQAISPWLDESLAEYSTALYYLKNGNGETYEKIRQNTISAVRARYAQGLCTAIGKSVYEYEEKDYSPCVYECGSLMWFTLYSLIGERMTLGLKKYCEQNAFCVAKPDTLIKALSEEGASEGWFNAWLNGKTVFAIG